jgi:ubiquinone/menaquinone biosynthesis C-methylase UbiE
MVSLLEPEKIINQIPIEEHFLSADFGCGAGGFTIPLARRSLKGLVYAFDIQDLVLSALQGNATAQGLNNIKPAKCDLEAPSATGVPTNSLDLVIMVNLLFQAEHDDLILKEAARIIKPGGMIIIIDWKKDAPFGPENKISLEEAQALLRRLDVKLKHTIDAGTYHWGAIFIK